MPGKSCSLSPARPSPKAKIGYESLINKGSLKLRTMAAITKQSQSNENWINGECDDHEKAMIQLLREACVHALSEQAIGSRGNL